MKNTFTYGQQLQEEEEKMSEGQGRYFIDSLKNRLICIKAAERNGFC